MGYRDRDHDLRRALAMSVAARPDAPPLTDFGPTTQKRLTFQKPDQQSSRRTQRKAATMAKKSKKPGKSRGC